MTAVMRTFGSREEWLKARKDLGRIGGSDIAAVIGISHWKSNVELWREKTGRAVPAEVSSPLVEYGTKAEKYIRGLFMLDFPEYEVWYEPGNIWTSDKMPYAHASLDGWLFDKEGFQGVLEIKTAMISSGRSADQWKGRIPDGYLAQLLWNMMVTESEFGILVAQLKYEIDGDMYKITRHYRIEAEDHREDMRFLQSEAERFWRYVKEDREPPAKLPEI